MANILVTQFTRSLGLMSPVVFSDVPAAVDYIVKHARRNAEINEENKARPIGQKHGQTGIELFATSAEPGKYKDSLGLDRKKIDPAVHRKISEGVRAALAL
ncbi:MAG TPA: hypothetical protein PKI93_04740 [Alphaproteobacteria bacterium]|nr:hypothetical protein [Alphaproteobacteria bacterium]HNS44007.1 hypothetical protein [Alphaproteobacteria bacterium]